jgi:hypothetical protein
MQTPVVSHYPAPALIDDFVLLFLPPCGPHLTPLANGSLESGLLVSPLLGGTARHRPFAPTLHLHQHKSSRNLHLQYSAKSQSTPRCQSLITARSDQPPVLGCSGPHQPKSKPKSIRFHCGGDGHKDEFCFKRRREERMAKEWANKDMYHPSNGVLEPRVQMPRAKASVRTVLAWGERKAVGGVAGGVKLVRPVWNSRGIVWFSCS